MKKTIILSLSILICGMQSYAKQKELYPYQDARRTIDERVEDLLSRMTLHEKVMQITQLRAGNNDQPQNQLEAMKGIDPLMGSFIYSNSDCKVRNQVQEAALKTRLGIPALFGYDVIHGFRNIYSVPLGVGCSWNTELYQKACAIAAKEARMSGVEWTFAPMIDVSRDPRWGRIMECYGEDTYANSRFCVAAVKGFQGDTISNPHNVAACLKHFIGYGASEAGRDYVYTEISDQTLWDTYIPPYEAGVKAGAKTVMSAFNCMSGIATSANPYTLKEILRNQWGFNGLVVSDWASVKQLVDQRVALDRKEASFLAITNGVDMNMGDNCFPENLEPLVQEGKLDTYTIDNAVRKVLKLKFELGLFENPMTKDIPESKRFKHKEDLELIRQLAEESFVLLKNENQLLPLQKGKKVAVVGPLADDQDDLLGQWKGHGLAEDVVSVFQGMKKEFGAEHLIHAKGCDIEKADTSGFAEAIEAVKKSDIAVVVLGENRKWAGESASRSDIQLPVVQVQLLKAVKRTGKPVVLILSNGRPLALTNVESQADAILEIWQPGIEGGNACAHVLSGAVCPSGKLDVTFPRSVGQVPIYYNRRWPARNGGGWNGRYQDIPSTPLYEFGYGLSYTQFAASDIKTSTTTVKRGQPFKVEISITNTGKCNGKETVHWYIAARSSHIARPMKELKFFEKKEIQKGETITYQWTVDPLRDLGFVDKVGHKFLHPGEYTISACGKSIQVNVVD